MNENNIKKPPLKLITISASFDINAAAAAKKPEEPASFNFLVYSGGILHLNFYSLPVVIDLQGLEVPKDQNISILLGHMKYHFSVAGNTTSINNDGKVLREKGILYNTVDAEVQKIVDKAILGHKWQCSVGALPVKIEYLPENSKTTVNSQEFKGPLYVARKSELIETSIVVLGADRGSEVDINANRIAQVKPLTIITT